VGSKLCKNIHNNTLALQYYSYIIYNVKLKL